VKKGILTLALALLSPMILAAQKLTIYCEDDSPMQFMGPDGKLSGMSVELVEEIQKRVGNTDEIKMVPWARGYDAVQKNPNIVLFSMGRTAERNPLFQWVGPIAESSFGLYAKAGSLIRIKTLDEAKKVHAIGVYRDDIRDQFLTKAGFTNLDRVNDNVTNFRKLMSGRVDLYASSSNDIRGNAERAGFRVADIKLVFVFLKTQVFIAMSKDTDPAIPAKWNEALRAMKRDGTFRRIFKAYYPDHSLPGPEITTF